VALGLSLAQEAAACGWSGSHRWLLACTECLGSD